MNEGDFPTTSMNCSSSYYSDHIEYDIENPFSVPLREALEAKKDCNKKMLKIGTGLYIAAGVVLVGGLVYVKIGSPETLSTMTSTFESCQGGITACAQSIYDIPDVFKSTAEVGMKMASAKLLDCTTALPEFCQNISNTVSICLQNVPGMMWDYLSWNASAGIENLGHISEVTHCQFMNGAWSCAQALNGLAGQITPFVPHQNFIGDMENLCNGTGRVVQILTSHFQL